MSGEHVNSLRSRNLISKWKIQMMEIFIEFFVPQIYIIFRVFVINSIVSFLIAHGKADLGKVMDRLKAATGERAVLDPQCSALIVTLLYHPLIV